MSGGSMNYLYSRIKYDANFVTDTPERRAFKRHLVDVARALRAIEWNDSGDGDNSEAAAIRNCVGLPGLLRSEVEHAEKVLAELAAIVGDAKNFK